MDTGWAVVLGASIAFVASLTSGFLLPWLREGLDRRRSAEASRKAELRRVLLETETSLLAYRHAKALRSGASDAQVRYFTAQNELSLILTPADQDVIDVFLMLFGAVQDNVAGVENIVGESIEVLNAWYRGEFPTSQLIAEIEKKAKIKFSDDRRSVGQVRQ